MGEMIFDVVVQFILIFPGAFVRWAFGGFKRKYAFYLDYDPGLNVFIGIILMVCIILLFNVW